MNRTKLGLSVVAGTQASGSAVAAHAYQEVRCAVRFPVELPVVVSAGAEERVAITKNVSASGVLFEMGSPLPVGEGIRFSMRMPGAILGTPHDVMVDCRGRVVRCSKSQTQSHIAATIDEYQFVEQ
jgi:hypothetical protein